MNQLEKMAALLESLTAPDPGDNQLFHTIVQDSQVVVNAADFARKFGMSRSTISRWQSGETVPHPALRPRLYAWLRRRTQEKLQEAAESASARVAAKRPKRHPTPAPMR